MKVIICGSRELWVTPQTIEEAVRCSGFVVTELVCGMAKGVDKSALIWAQSNNIPVIEMPFKKQYGVLGGFMRNQDMVQIADAWIAVINSPVLTKGTKDCYNRAAKANLPMYLYNTNGLF